MRPSLNDDMGGQCCRDAWRRSVIEGRASGRNGAVQTPSSKFENRFHLLARDGKLLQDLVDRHAIFEVLENRRRGRSPPFEHPGAGDGIDQFVGTVGREGVRAGFAKVDPFRMAHRELHQPVRERRQAAAGVDQDRHPRLLGEPKDPVERARQPVAVERERLRARMELDATRASRERPIVFGHWSTLGLMQREDAVCLDTGCLWGGALTAMSWPQRAVVQVACPGDRKPR